MLDMKEELRIRGRNVPMNQMPVLAGPKWSVRLYFFIIIIILYYSSIVVTFGMSDLIRVFIVKNLNIYNLLLLYLAII